MNNPLKDVLEQLINQKPEPCVSLYMPTHRAGQEVRQDPIRFKNLLKRAGEELLENDFKEREVNQMLKPALALLEDNFFWNHQSDGLTLFLSSENFIYYRLPYTFAELVIVNRGFYLKPLLPVLSNDGLYFILALDKKNLKFYQASRFSVREIELPDVPKSLEEALKYDDLERQYQFHTESTPHEGGRTVMFHGHGTGIEDDKKQILEFFRMVDKGVRSYLNNQNAPLVLAGLEYLQPIYRKASSYSHLIEAGIEKDPQALEPGRLSQLAWETVGPAFSAEQNAAIARYRDLLGKGKASNNMEEIVAAAYSGKVESLFVDIHLQRWGQFDPNTHGVKIYDKKEMGYEDLLDFAAVHTIVHDGTVYGYESDNMPVNSPIAAVFRY